MVIEENLVYAEERKSSNFNEGAGRAISVYSLSNLGERLVSHFL